MNTEMKLLVQVTGLTALLWIPYTLDRIAVRGLAATVGYPEAPRAQTAWATRLRSAHANATENLVVFATLILVAQAAGVSTPVTVLASHLYLWSRVVHAAAYALAVPWVRTLAFVGGFAAQSMLVLQLLT